MKSMYKPATGASASSMKLGGLLDMRLPPTLMTCFAFALGGPSAFAQTPKDTVVMAKQIDDIISLDPAEAFEFSGSEAVANIYDRLIGINFSNVSELRGELAETWSVAEDGKRYTFKIRPNVRFHSGNPVTAEDAAWSLQRAVILNKSPGFILTQFGFTKENAASRIRATDPLTLIIETEKPVAPTFFYNCLTAGVGSVVDSKLVKANAKGDDLGNEWLKTNSAGSAAYKLRSWSATEVYTLAPNANWSKGGRNGERFAGCARRQALQGRRQRGQEAARECRPAERFRLDDGLPECLAVHRRGASDPGELGSGRREADAGPQRRQAVVDQIPSSQPRYHDLLLGRRLPGSAQQRRSLFDERGQYRKRHEQDARLAEQLAHPGDDEARCRGRPGTRHQEARGDLPAAPARASKHFALHHHVPGD